MTTAQLKNFSLNATKLPLTVYSQFFHHHLSQPLSVSVDLSFLEIPCKWNHSICRLLCLASFI